MLRWLRMTGTIIYPIYIYLLTPQTLEALIFDNNQGFQVRISHIMWDEVLQFGISSSSTLTRLHLRELPRHRRIPARQSLDRHVLRLVVGEAQVAVGAE